MKQDNELPVRQLIKFSNYSLCITLPKEYIDNLGWQQGDRITFKIEQDHNLILSRTSQKPQTNENEKLMLPPNIELNEFSADLNDDLEPIPQIN